MRGNGPEGKPLAARPEKQVLLRQRCGAVPFFSGSYYNLALPVFCIEQAVSAAAGLCAAIGILGGYRKIRIDIEVRRFLILRKKPP